MYNVMSVSAGRKPAETYPLACCWDFTARISAICDIRLYIPFVSAFGFEIRNESKQAWTDISCTTQYILQADRKAGYSNLSAHWQLRRDHNQSVQPEQVWGEGEERGQDNERKQVTERKPSPVTNTVGSNLRRLYTCTVHCAAYPQISVFHCGEYHIQYMIIASWHYPACSLAEPCEGLQEQREPYETFPSRNQPACLQIRK